MDIDELDELCALLWRMEEIIARCADKRPMNARSASAGE